MIKLEIFRMKRSFLTVFDCKVSKLYNFPKIHKIDAPIEPTVNTISSPCDRLAKPFANYLKPYVVQSRILQTLFLFRS